MNADVKDLKLADSGRKLIDWADRQMSVLRRIRERFTAEKPLDGVRIAAGLHITPETAVLMRTLIPPEIDEFIARLKLESLGVRIDTPSSAQLAYANAWDEGT